MSKKSATFAAEKVAKEMNKKKKSSPFVPVWRKNFKSGELVLERTSRQKCESWKPGEAMGIRDMLIRTERGQRLDIKCRFRAEGIPDNMYQAQFNEKGEMLPDPNEETFDHTPPSGIVDPVDILRYEEELSQRKAEMMRKKKETVANASKSAPNEKTEGKAQGDPSDETKGA